MLKNEQRRFATIDARFAVTPQSNDRPAMLAGYAAKWNTLSADRGGYKVRLMPGSASFADVVHAIYHHQFADILGTTQNQSLRLSNDDVGIRFEVDLPDTALARDVFALVKGGYVRGMSFAMTEMPWGWGMNGLIAGPDATITTEGGTQIVSVKRFTLYEITVTPRPAFTETVVMPGPSSDFSARNAQSIKLQQFRLDQFKAAGSALHRDAA